jgi:glycosyltransferase involved in cell wall biosynthesis
MRIALVMISNFGPGDGGRETWAYNFIPRLLECWPEAKLDVVGLRREGQPDNTALVEKLIGSRGSVTFVESRRKRFPVLSMLSAARGLLPASAPDLVISVGSAMEQLVTLLSLSLRQAKRILWLRTILTHERAHQLPKWMAGIVSKMEALLLRSAHLLIANGEDTAAYYRQRGLDVSVIPNGVDTSRWRASPPKLKRPLRVLFAGRTVAVKGFPEFLEVAQRMGGPEFEFHVVGDFAGKGVIGHGALPNEQLPSIVGEMDVCVALTRQSAQGGGGGVSNALLEQMASGRVIIAWRNSIFTQVLDDSNAYLVPQGDVDAAAEALRSIASDPDEARRRARQAALDASRYSFDAHMAKFMKAAGSLMSLQP